MTELVRNRPSPPTSIGRQLCAWLVAAALTLALPGASRAAPAAGEPTETSAETETETETEAEPAELPDQAAIQAALADGDLTTAKQLAVARSDAAPTPENFELEAEVWLALGDYENARRAYGQALDGLPADASQERRRAITEQIEAIEATSRGTRADEPESSHRERLDRERAERLAALVPKPPAPEVVDSPKREPIVKKWYFWVTLGALVASAGAIVGLAVSAAIDDRQANADAAVAGRDGRRPIPAGGVVFRF